MSIALSRIWLSAPIVEQDQGSKWTGVFGPQTQRRKCCLLQYNDNSANPFSDGNWLAVVIEAVGAAKYSPQVRHQCAPMAMSGVQPHLNVDTDFSASRLFYRDPTLFMGFRGSPLA
jgi:hypothetical protein